MKLISNSFALPLALCGALCAWPASGRAQSANTMPTPKPFDPASNSTNPSASATQAQNPFLGSTPTIPLVEGTRHISLDEAVRFALQTNLGLIDATATESNLRAARLKALSTMLPHIDASLTTHQTALNGTEASGGKKIGLPNIIGPYSYQAYHLNMDETAFEMRALHALRGARDEAEAASYTALDGRNIVVLAAASGYIAIAATESRVHADEAELASTEALHALMRDRVEHGVSPNIDLIRAQVAAQTAAQRLDLARMQLKKDKYALARVIGMPVEQEFDLASPLSYQSAPQATLDELLAKAASARADLKAVKASDQAAEEGVKAAAARRLPVLGIHGNVGAGGVNSARLYGTYDIGASLTMPVFTGGAIAADVRAAKSTAMRRHAEVADLEERVRFDVRDAWLDLESAERSVRVADGNLQLARQGSKEARDRFEVGVSTSLDVLEAQRELAEAEDNYISSVYAHNLAKLMLIRATGRAEAELSAYVGGK